MSLTAHVKNAKRYAQIVRLLWKYGSRDLVRSAGLEDVLAEEDRVLPAGADPGELVDDLEALGPTFVKLGQLLSTRADFLPLPYVQALSRLQDHVEPIAYAEVEETVERELGARMSKLYESFDEKPLASASLGQVHRAVMRDGRQVAVKVQRPGIRDRVAEDLELLADVARFLDAHADVGKRWDFSAIVDQFRETLVREMDYRLEARNLVTIGRNLDGLALVCVPRPVEGFTSGRVLTMEFVHGKKITDVSKLRRIDLDGVALAEQLFQAYLKQILVDGFFHADPHPGNVFLTDDDRIALIDLGMVARLSQRMRDQLLKLIVAVSTGAGDEAAEVAFEMSTPLPWFDRDGARRDISALVAWNEGLAVEDIQVGGIVLELTRMCGKNGLRAPPELALLGKTLLNLDKVGRTLDPEFDPNASVRRNAGAIATRRVREGASIQHFLGSIVDARDFIRAFPARANKIMDAVANNELKVTVDAIDEDRLIAGLQKIANRITVGLILASLVIGAALIMRVPATWTIGGYPGFAILLFAAAALGSGWMALHILRRDGRNAKGSAKPPD